MADVEPIKNDALDGLRGDLSNPLLGGMDIAVDRQELAALIARLDQAEARGAWLLTDNRRLRILAGGDDPADVADLQRIAGKPVGMLEASAVGGGRKFDPAGPSAPPRAGGEK